MEVFITAVNKLIIIFLLVLIGCFSLTKPLVLLGVNKIL